MSASAQSPFQQDSAAKRPKLVVRTVEDQVRMAWSSRLRDTRAAAGGYWKGGRYAPLPEYAWLVEDLLTPTQLVILDVMKEIVLGAHNRPRVGGVAAIKGVKTGDHEGTAYASLSALTWLLDQKQRVTRKNNKDGERRAPIRTPYATIQRHIQRLIAKHVIEPTMAVLKVGEKIEGRRDARGYRLLPWSETLRRCKADENICTSHGTLIWHNGRKDSKQLLTRFEGEQWKIAELERPASRQATGKVSSDSSVVAPPAAAARQGRGLTIEPALKTRLDILLGRGGTIGNSASMLANELRTRGRAHEILLNDIVVGRVCEFFLLEKRGATHSNGWQGIDNTVGWVLDLMKRDVEDKMILKAFYADEAQKRDASKRIHELLERRREQIRHNRPLSDGDAELGAGWKREWPELWTSLLASTQTDWHWKPRAPYKKPDGPLPSKPRSFSDFVPDDS